MHAQAAQRADRRLGVRDGDVDVQRERRLAPRELAHRVVDRLVARAGGDLDVAPLRERVRAGDAARRPSGARSAASPARRSASSPPRPATVVCGPVKSSSAEPCVSAAAWSATSRESAGSTSSIRDASDQSCGSRSMTSSSSPTVHGASAPPGSSRPRPAAPSRQHPRVLRAAVLRGVDDERALVERDPGEPSGQDARRRRAPASTRRVAGRRAGAQALRRSRSGAWRARPGAARRSPRARRGPPRAAPRRRPRSACGQITTPMPP